MSGSGVRNRWPLGGKVSKEDYKNQLSQLQSTSMRNQQLAKSQLEMMQNQLAQTVQQQKLEEARKDFERRINRDFTEQEVTDFFVMVAATIGPIYVRVNPDGYPEGFFDSPQYKTRLLNGQAAKFREFRAEIFGAEFAQPLNDEHVLTIFAYAQWCTKKAHENK